MEIAEGKIRPVFFKYLAAASGSALAASVFAFIDAIMVGKYHGPSGTAALAVFNPCWTIVYSLGMLTGIGGATLFANARGKDDEQMAQKYFSASVIYGIILSCISFLVLVIFTDQIFSFFGADRELLSLAKQYFASIRFAIPMCVFANILSAFLRNDGNPGLSVAAVFIGGVLNAAGDYIFVFVFNMGIFGAGLATAIGISVTTLVMTAHFFTEKNTLKLVKPHKFAGGIIKISKIGLATGIIDLSMGIIGILFNRQIMRYFGTDALAVYGILGQLTAFAQCSAYGIGEAAQPIMSHGYGAKRFDRIHECLKYALLTCAGMGVFWIIATQIEPNMYVRIFMKPTESVLIIAPAIIRMYCVSYLILPFNLFAPYYFQSLLKPAASIGSSVLRSIVFSVITITLMPLVTGQDSIWLAMLVSESAAAVINCVLIIKYTKSLAKR